MEHQIAICMYHSICIYNLYMIYKDTKKAKILIDVWDIKYDVKVNLPEK